MSEPRTTVTPGRYLDELPAGSYVHVSDLPGSADAAKAAASRAARKGHLVPVARGLYFKGMPTRYGMATPPPEDIALEVARRIGVGPAGVSAARALGLTTQVPAVPELAVVGRVPDGVAGVRMSRRNNTVRCELNYTEIAVLETLRNWASVVDHGWSALVKAVRDRVRTGEVKLDRLRRAVAAERLRAVKEAFGRLVEALSMPLGATA